jgi:hypothetical protein
MMLGRALVGAGEIEEGRRMLRQGHADWMAAGSLATGSEYASHAAEALLNVDLADEAVYFVEAGEALLDKIGERFFEAELLRQRGRLVERGVRRTHETAESAETCYRRAIEVAEHQGSRLFTLRAATDLARWLIGAGRGAEANAVLRPVYASFQEGFEYPDFARARAVLERL